MNRGLSLLFAALLLASPALAPAQDKPAGPTLTPYGFIMGSGLWNSGTFNNKDYPGQVCSQTGVAAPSCTDGGAFLMNARQSRVGFRLGYADANWTGATLSGQVEFDFQGGHVSTSSTGWYNGLMRLRIASGTASWKTGYGSWQVLAGQDTGLVNPLFATSISWIAAPLFWQAGNLWRRAPQFRLTYGNNFDNFGVVVQAAMLSPADAGGTQAVDFGAGNRSRQPDLEGRLAFSGKFGQDLNATLGVGYHTNVRRYVVGATAADLDLRTSLIGIDVQANLTQYLEVKAEWYQGEGTDDTHNAIAPGVVGATTPAVGTTKLGKGDGFWGQLIIKPIPEISVTAGYGVAKADKALLGTAAAANDPRYENSQMAAGIIANAGKYWKFGVEYCATETKYLLASVGSQKAAQIALTSLLAF